MNLESTFTKFSGMLEERFELGVFTTEDSIRYTFYSALISSGGLKHTDLVLEHPHPALPGAEIDTIIIRSGDGRQPVAVEFKYDRGNPGGTNQNRTQRAAAVLLDVFRLVMVPSSLAAAKYFVYVTDAEMAGYFRNPINRLCDFFDLREPRALALGAASFQGFSQTFMARVQPFLCECRVSRAFAAESAPLRCLPSNNSLERMPAKSGGHRSAQGRWTKPLSR